jgi:hypothetical protein
MVWFASPTLTAKETEFAARGVASSLKLSATTMKEMTLF